MIMNIVSLILTILFGVGGIIISLYCWMHNYEKQKEQDKIVQRLNALNFNDEHMFSELTNIIDEANKHGIDISNYFNVNKKDKITKNEILSAIYNMYDNIENNSK